MNRFIKSNITKVFVAFLVWRISLFAIAGLAPLVISPNFGKSFPYWQERLVASGLPHFIWSFGNFDGVHYLGIAKDAYSAQYTQVFFPFYPILIRLVSYLTFGNLIVSALLISNLTFLAGLIIFYKLISQTHTPRIALWSSAFLLSFPTSYYFGAVYTEGLFFFILILSFYLVYKNKIVLASAVGSFASATRLAGLFLAPAIAAKKGPKSLIPMIVIPLGFAIYVLYLKIKFNNPLYFLSAQSIFGQERSTTGIILLPQVIFRYLKILFTTNGLPFVNAVFEFTSTIFAFTMLAIAFKKVRFEWLIFSFLAILIPTLTGTLASMPRYILVAFPIYPVLASIENFRIKVFIIIVSSILLAIFTTLFTQGYWVA